jgi:hypothetical protein
MEATPTSPPPPRSSLVCSPFGERRRPPWRVLRARSGSGGILDKDRRTRVFFRNILEHFLKFSL